MPRTLPTASLLFAALIGCKGANEPPLLTAPLDQKAKVAHLVDLTFNASDPDGDRLSFRFDGPLPNLANRATFEPTPTGARFRWTPLLSDIGTHTFTFEASDGEDTTTRRVTLDVVSGEGSSAPTFLQPLGTGTTLDLGQAPCFELAVAVTDPDTPGVTLSQQEPVLPGATLTQDSELAGTWAWCPAREQVATSDRYTLRLGADDYDNDTVFKDYLLVLRSTDGAGCPGGVPTVTHRASDWEGVLDVPITAEVYDAEGLKFEPLLYYSTSHPGSPPDITQMTQVTMQLTSGSMQDGTWSASIPNPVANQPGTFQTVHYLIAATDNDDAEGACDHTTQAPEGGAYQITVTNPAGGGGATGAPVCASCSADVQCGDGDDLCIPLDGENICGAGCDDDSDCPDSHYCSFGTFTSVDGAAARQCLPTELSCSPAPSCDDDDYEDNDTLATARSLGEGTHRLTSCPADSGDDEDWFVVDVGSESTLELILDGGSGSDLDLGLYDPSGTLIASSAGTSSFEAIEACVPPGDYTVHVAAYGAAVENDYDLDIDIVSGNCDGTCDDDGHEPDDDYYSADWADLDYAPWRATDRQICAWNEDWYEVYLLANEDLYVTLDFAQTTAEQDLDLMLIDYYGYIVLGCDEYDPSWCDPSNGQSGTADETLQFANGSWDDSYYVIVRGWSGAENAYDICLGLSAWDCP